MLKGLLLFLLSNLLLSSCSFMGTAMYDDPLVHFSSCPFSKIKVNKEIDLEASGIYKPWAINKQDDTYLIYDYVDTDVIKMLSPSSGLICKGINRGNGPGEILHTQGLFKDGNVFKLLDDIRMVKYTCSIGRDSIYLILDENYESLQSLYNPAFYQDWIISTTFQDSVWIRYYKDKQLINTIGFPQFEQTEELTAKDKSWAFISMRFRFKPDGKRAVGALQSGCLISFFDCTESGISESVQHKYFPLDFAYTGKESRSIGETPDSRVGFCGLTCTDNYIYALYSGKTMENLTSAFRASHVFVYDWEGRPVKRYELEKELFGDIGVDEETGILYGIGYDPEGCIIEYKLN